MKWDKKIALYLTMFYFIYAFSNCFTLGDFVPPLPLFPFLIPFLGLVYFLKTPFSITSVLMLIVSFGVPSHILIFLHPLLIQVLSFSALLSMVLLGLLLFRYFYFNDKLSYNFLWCIVMILSPILIMDNKWVMFGFFILLGVSSLICLRINSFDNSKSISEYRMFLLIGFICVLYSINFISLLSIELFN